MDDLTELEFTVLAIIGLYAPCSGYRVRKCFLDSPSPHWSGSAGAIYPALRRLESRELLTTRPDTSNRRGGALYALSPAGRRAARAWLAPPLADVALIDHDPLRTRVRMLGLLTPSQRSTFLESADEALADMEQTARETLRRSRDADDVFHTMVCEGALASMQARRAWLKSVRRTLDATPATARR